MGSLSCIEILLLVLPIMTVNQSFVWFAACDFEVNLSFSQKLNHGSILTILSFFGITPIISLFFFHSLTISLSHCLTLSLFHSLNLSSSFEILKKEICFHKQSRCHGKIPINIFRWLKWLFGEWSTFFAIFLDISTSFHFSAFFPLI